MRRAVIFAIAAPVVVWLGLIVVGKERPDNAGTALWTNHGFLIGGNHGLLIEAVGVGLLAAWLTQKGSSDV